MIGGANKEPKRWINLTGVGSVQPVAVNPTNEQYLKITGNEMPFELKYDVTELSEVQYRPVKILVHNHQYNVFAFANFWISNQDEVSKKGDKVNSMDPKGVMTYIPVDGSGVDYTWFDAAEATPLKRGEASLHNFLQILVKYDQKAEEANWRMDLLEAGITADKIFADDLTGLQALIDWSNTQDVGDSGAKGHQIGVLFEVRKTAKTDKETGEEVEGQFNYNQVVNNRNFFYASADGNIPQGAFKRLQKIRDDQEAAGYQVTKNLWTFTLQEFNEATCEGNAPEDTAEGAPDGKASPMKWV